MDLSTHYASTHTSHLPDSCNLCSRSLGRVPPPACGNTCRAIPSRPSLPSCPYPRHSVGRCPSAAAPAEDADADGSHIRGLYLGFFQRYAKWMLENHMIKYLRTPIAAIVENKKLVKYWFTLTEMNEFLNKTKLKSNQTLKYYKGLGSWKADSLSDLINNNGGLENFLEDLDIDDESEKILDDWIGDKPENVLARKTYLKDYQLDINKV